MTTVLYSRDRLLELSGQDAGELAEVSFPALLLAHALQGGRVELRLRRGHVDKRIFFEGGGPVDCRSNLLHETIGRYLVQQGRLSEEAYQECLRDSVARGALIGEILIERGRIDSAELFRALQQNLARKLLDVFTWREAHFAVVREPPSTGSSLKVKVPQLVLTGVSRFAPAELVDRWIAPLAAATLSPSHDPLVAPTELRLSPEQSRLLALLEERPRGLGDLARDAAQDAEDTARWVAGLAMLGAVAVGAVEPPARTPAPTPPPGPAVAAPAAIAAERTDEIPPAGAAVPVAATESVPRPRSATATTGGEEAARLAKSVHEAYLNFRRQDAFDLLGVAEDAPLAFVRYQYLDFARRFAPWRFEAGRLAPLAEQARELFLAGALAYAELEQTESREALRFRRQRAREEAAREKSASYFQIQTDLLDPETQFTKGLALREAGRLRPAIQQLEFAVDCDPGNALYLAELAWTRFSESPAAAKRAYDDLKQAMRLDPQAGLPMYYAGEVCAALGDRAQAEVLLRRSIKPLAPDRRPLEALRRLSTERRR
jgi:hypothetical protein